MESRYVLRPRPAVRAFALAALMALGGAGLMIAASQLDGLGWMVVAGAVLILFGVGLVGLAVGAAWRHEVTITLTDTGYQIVEPGGARQGTWDTVTRVTGAPGRVTLHQGPENRVVLVVPAERAVELDVVAADIARRLDADRGYSSLL
ncbi:MAG: hypothetical protein ACK5LN_01080 [Propioniciclava sp.]